MKTLLLIFLISSFSVFGQEEDCCYCPITLKDPLRDPQTWEKLAHKPTDRQLWERYVSKLEVEWTKETQDSVKKWKQILMLRNVLSLRFFQGFYPKKYATYYAERGVFLYDWEYETIMEYRHDYVILNKIIEQNPNNAIRMFIFREPTPYSDQEATEKHLEEIFTILGYKFLRYENRPTDWLEDSRQKWNEMYKTRLQFLLNKQIQEISTLLSK